MPSLKAIAQGAKDLFITLRNDRQAQQQLRQLVLGLVICGALLYAGFSLLITPKELALLEKTAKLKDVEHSLAGMKNASDMVKFFHLGDEKLSLEERIAILSLQRQYMQEHWSRLSNPERFTKIIFTLLPAAPLNFKDNITQMQITQGAADLQVGADQLTLDGKAEFRDLLRYLNYLESQPEVSIINSLELTRPKPARDASEKETMISFKLHMTRVNLRKIL